DLATEIDTFEAVAAKRYLPVHKMPRRAVEWLDDALQGGTVTGAQLSFVGPLAAFPFDGGEGTFRATARSEGGVRGYAREWPRAARRDGAIGIADASGPAAGSGRVLGNRGDGVSVGIGDLRSPVLTIDADTRGPLGDVLAFLKDAPQIARELGPGYDRVEAPAGDARVS